MSCKRCGWGGKPLPKISFDVPEEGKSSLPLSALDPHPEGTCCSPYRIGDKIAWNGGGRSDDLPPLWGTFHSVYEFFGPEYIFEHGTWVQVKAASPSLVLVQLDATSITDAHRELLGDEIDAEIYAVAIFDLTPADQWPVIVESPSA